MSASAASLGTVPRRRHGAGRLAREAATATVGFVLAATVLIPLARGLGMQVLVVRSGSMGDSLPTGSVAFARWKNAREVRRGDVVAVYETAVPKVHRIVSLRHDRGRIVVRTKGDANPAIDPLPYVLPPRVGVVWHSLPYLGVLVGIVTTPLGWLLLLALPSAGLCFSMLRRVWDLGGRKRIAAAPEPSLERLPVEVEAHAGRALPAPAPPRPERRIVVPAPQPLLAEVEVQLVRAPPAPLVVPEPLAAPGPPAPVKRGPWNVVALERRLAGAADVTPEQLEEWRAYLYYLRGYASADGSLPDAFDDLVDDVFAELAA